MAAEMRHSDAMTMGEEKELDGSSSITGVVEPKDP